ncbi:SET domain-containing protein [Segetibacter koreensis]|uniref:SET domain-containing protein n=1 Tax=Segetibacter koreensis TaxID=398037 RepID=UPI00037713A0|nr:SET domain-containing protein [Segetibacter koreensis]
MIHPKTELRFINDKVGYGVVATEFIPKGTITWAYDQLDRSFTPADIESLDRVYKDILHKYCYRDSKGNYVLCWDNSRFVNHSFNSNCISTAYNFELAVRDIHPGEELTDDYGYLNCLEPFVCLPEQDTSRTCVMPDDLLHFYKEWDNKLQAAFTYFNSVDQPLAFLIEPSYRYKVDAIALGIESMDSILNCFYNDDENLMIVKEGMLHSFAS